MDTEMSSRLKSPLKIYRAIIYRALTLRSCYMVTRIYRSRERYVCIKFGAGGSSSKVESEISTKSKQNRRFQHFFFHLEREPFSNHFSESFSREAFDRGATNLSHRSDIIMRDIRHSQVHVDVPRRKNKLLHLSGHVM